MSELAALICQAVGEEWFTTAYIYHTLDVKGQRNQHLANPLNRDPNVFYFRPRATPLTGEEEIYGDLLLFDYVEHDGRMYLEGLGSLAEIEQRITGKSGITNAFSTYMIAIVHNKVKPYQIYCRDKRAQERGIFDKEEQRLSPDPFDMYDDVQIQWIAE